ncbi:E3 ubiquitin-protein ligase PRT6 isoform X2 [Physcomitrium patens]|uniref:E3 ubiquitin-protein ligase n=2 Tax=Physcomitrium patens TaxID=3218 RepID=A0A7I4B2T2_PHYPA|nr:E3 ubiquitin-protein ligase PRT6-like isoform X2 [Physcomitrium patens]|eukprot:XP_024397713.1 E3 ubiquitin-protein ligase PRT6-like isoform X2 [Physcomitrella patens]
MSEPRPSRRGVEEAKALLHERSLWMSGGEPLDSYLDDFRALGQLQCTYVWTKDVVAYRCRTCQMNDSSAICNLCFQNGNHWDHDYVMYHSASGGCCDCGDLAAWKESGACAAHQRLHVQEPKLKDELLEPTHVVVQYVLRELLVWVKKLKVKLSYQRKLFDQNTDLEVAMAMIYLDWSQKVCAVDALRSIVCNEIIDYGIPCQTDAPTSALEILLDCLGWMPDKLIEAETTLFLQLLYKNDFKDKFLNLLREKYEKMIFLAIRNKEYMKNYTHLDTNLDRVMVQLFNDPDMTTRLIHKHNLLELFIGVFSKVIACSAENNELAVVSFDGDAIKCKVYLRPQSDLRLVVSHRNIAIHMLSKQPQLFPHILDVLVKLQWMNAYTRGGDGHVFEKTWTLAIQLEMNSMAIIFQLISRCFQDPLGRKKTLVTAATYTFKVLKQYLEQVKRISDQDKYSDSTVSLHIPLHRALSAILQKLVLISWGNYERGFLTALKEEGVFNFTEDEVLALMDHPLRILVWMAQIRAQMWSTLEHFSRLELIYRGSFWHDQSMDMDILLLQFCSVACEDLQGKIFVKIAELFNFKSMATTRTIPGQRNCRQAEIMLLQSFMRLILLVVRERRNLGRTEEDEAQGKCLQYDVIQWLCVRDQTYSQLCRALGSTSIEHQKLNVVLDRVAVYHEPKVAHQGYYQLKSEYWKEFDPLFPHYYLNELEEAEDRAVKVGKSDHYWRISAPSPAGAPYDRLSGLLHTKACHLFLLNVLDEVRFLVERDTTVTSGEALGVTALQMMAVLVSDSRNNLWDADLKAQFPDSVDEYPTEDITVNIYVQVRTEYGPHLSIFQMLQELVRANQCTRLVDSINHVFEFLHVSTHEKSRAAEVDTLSAEDIQRRLRKELRQKAILEEFSAKRKAFMELQSDCDDDENSEDGSEMEACSIVNESRACKSGSVPISETLRKATTPVTDADHVAMEASSKAKECALCKTKKDDKNSSLCWIALVQRYNFPNQVLSRGEQMRNTGETDISHVGQFQGLNLNDDLDQLVTVGYFAESGNATTIDLSTLEHVQCCGHQMHYDCFQDHMKNLQLSCNAGNDVVNPLNGEFSCPICRRLANVLLPDVDASISSRKMDLHEDVKGADEIGSDWSSFWQSNKNLENSMDSFCVQTLRVRKQYPHSYFNTPSSCARSRVLWEELVLNIVHCEVETREGYVQVGTASSSSPTMKFSDECTWGGDSAHWTAMRELGRLAMLSNTFPGAVQDKSQRLRALWECLRLLDRRENLDAESMDTESSPILAGMSELERTVREMFPQNPIDLAEPCEDPEFAQVSSLYFHCQDGSAQKQENSQFVPVSCNVDMGEEELARTQTTLNQSVHLEENKNSQFVEFKLGETYPSKLAAPDPIEHDPQQRHEISFEDAKIENKIREEMMIDGCLSQPFPIEQQRNTSSDSLSTWMEDILRNGILTADPFWVLAMLLIILSKQPDRHVLLSMVKFAYTIAVLQTQIAVSRLDVEDSDVETLVRRACLPFLRRAAMLVQIVTREDLREHGLTGMKVMDFHSLQLILQLPDCSLILQPQGATAAMVTQLLHLYRPKSFNFEMHKVPRKALLHKLPRVYQKLLMEGFYGKKCAACGETPLDPAICLVCGMLLCCGADRRGNGIGECSQHAATESAGVGIFLLLRSTQLLLLRNNRTCMGLSLYLDIHGDEDLYMRRNQKMYLSDLRLNEIRRLWMTAAFDYDSYILRNSQLMRKAY